MIDSRIFSYLTFGRMLGRDDDRRHFDRAAIDVAHRDLALGVGAQKIELTGFAELGEIFHQPMRHRDRQRHDFGRLVAREAEHQALIAGALFLVQAFALGDALRDVGRLRLDRGQDGAHVAVEADFGAVVADVDGGLPRDFHIVRTRLAGDFAGQHDEPGLGERLERDARVGVFGQQRVEDGIRNLVAHFVRMAFGDRFGSEEEILKRHYSRLLLAKRFSGARRRSDSADAGGARA